MISKLFIAFLLLHMDIPDTNSTTSFEGDWETLTQANYAIEYPKEWELNLSGQMGSSFIILSPQESDQDLFRENVNLLIQDLTGTGIDLDRYTAISEDQVKTMVTNSNLIESIRMKPKSGEYHKIIYTGDQGIYHIKYEQYYWMLDEKAYILTLTCELDKFETYQETGERIMNSFAFKK